MKPKSNRSSAPGPKSINSCQTPAYALTPLLKFCNLNWRVWEPAAGEGLLVSALANAGFAQVFASDILTGQSFFAWEWPEPYDAIITNGPWTPFALKSQWIRRCVELDKPFATLVPLETMGAGTLHPLFQEANIEFLVPDKRIAYKMPNRGFEGSSPQMPSCWLTAGLGIGRTVTFVKIYPEKPILEGYYQTSMFDLLPQRAPVTPQTMPSLQMELELDHA